MQSLIDVGGTRAAREAVSSAVLTGTCAAALQLFLEMVTISSIDPSDAQEAARWRPDNDARVDLEGDAAAPSS
jgi:hypothetical protein